MAGPTEAGWPAAGERYPPAAQRDGRDLTRDRAKLGQERSREVTRGQGVLARATITMAAVAAASMGGSGRAIVAALSAGRAAPAAMAEVATGRWRPQIPGWAQALTGRGWAHPRRLRALPGAPLDGLEAPREALRADITRRRSDLRALPRTTPPAPPAGGTRAGGNPAAPVPPAPPMTLARAVTVLDPMPGVERRGGARWVAEGGMARPRVGTAARLAAWSGVAPGNAARAGQPRAGKTRQSHRALRTGLTPLAHAAALPTGTAVSAWSHRLAARRGQQRTIMAVAHARVVSAFHRRSRHDPDHA